MNHENKEIQYHIVMENSLYTNLYETIFYDLFKEKHAEKISSFYEDAGLKKAVLNLLYKNKLNRLLKGNFEPLLKPQFSLEAALKRHPHAHNVVIFLNPCMQKVYSAQNLQRIKESVPHCYFILLFVDSVFQYQAQKAYEISQSGIFDLIYTFDKFNADEYGFLLCNTPYSKYYDITNAEDNAMYFCGSVKGRGHLLNDIAKSCNAKKIPYDFDVYSEQKEETYLFPVKHSGYMPYVDLLKKTLSHNCILDVVQDGQAGLSLRVNEAAVYNRILITNNKNIVNHPLYNPEYMHYIGSPDEIDPEWLVQKAQYHYNGQMSPLYFVKDIENRLFPHM